MNCISLVCTVHDEVGRANASELHAILVRIRPQVIFLEVPIAAMEDFYGAGNRRNLESDAVRKYRENHQVQLVAVDLPTPEREFFEDHEHLHNRTREASSEYRQLLRLDRDYVRMHGFAYLNSEHCSKLRSEIDEEMLSTIKRIGDSRLVDIHESWMRKLVCREKAMMENIRKYCGENTFDKGAFLVGAAHRQPIIDKSREDVSVRSAKLQWDSDGWMHQMTAQSGG